MANSTYPFYNVTVNSDIATDSQNEDNDSDVQQFRQSGIIQLSSGDSWPLRCYAFLQIIGFILIFVGFVGCFLALLEVLIIPFMYGSASRKETSIALKWDNVFGMTLWTGLIALIAGTLALRVLLTKRLASLRKFYVATCVTGIMAAISIVLFAVSFRELKSHESVSPHTVGYAMRISHIVALINTLCTAGSALAGVVVYGYDLCCCTPLSCCHTAPAPYREQQIVY